MKDHPIIFKGEMVRAIMAGRKTQTRRVIKPQPSLIDGTWTWLADGLKWSKASWADFISKPEGMLRFCPYGQVGDKLWVRETFVIECTREYHSYLNIQKPTDRPFKRIDDEDGEYFHIPHYRATEPEPHITDGGEDGFDDITKWSPSIFMPKWACRLWLEITNIRVERVQEIIHKDMRAEGVNGIPCGTGLQDYHYAKSFMEFWDSINAKRGFGWAANPWVWGVTFKVTKVS